MSILVRSSMILLLFESFVDNQITPKEVNQIMSRFVVFSEHALSLSIQQVAPRMRSSVLSEQRRSRKEAPPTHCSPKTHRPNEPTCTRSKHAPIAARRRVRVTTSARQDERRRGGRDHAVPVRRGRHVNGCETGTGTGGWGKRASGTGRDRAEQ